MVNKGGCRPGHTNNPNGRPRAGSAFLDQLKEALKKVEKEKGKTLMRHMVERAFLEDTVMVALAKKLLPDLKEVDNKAMVRFDHFAHQINDYKK